MIGMTPEQISAYATGMAGLYSKLPPVPAKPNNLVSRETTGVEDFKWAPGATKETVYHHYSNGKTVSIERVKYADGWTRVLAIELLDNGTFGVLRHSFASEDN